MKNNKVGYYESIRFTNFISAVLGFTEQKKESLEDSYIGLYPHLFDYGQTRMFIYTNIVKSQNVGNELAPIIRITNFSGTDGKIQTQEFTHLQYVPINVSHIDYIHMYIRSESGDYLPFDVGTFSASLHFRQKRY
jgi:hypothetical protein